MKIRNICAFLLVAAAAAACIRDGEHFTVHGTLTDEAGSNPGSLVYLISQDGPVDSVGIKDGKFTFSGRIDKTRQLVAMLRYPGKDPYDERFIAVFVPDAKDIYIDLDYPATVTGSPLTDEISAYQEKASEIYYERESDIGSLSINGEQERADSIYKSQMKKIADLSRETFLANTDNVLGLQAFTMLIDELGPEELEQLAASSALVKENAEIQALLEGKKKEAQTGVGAMFSDITGTSRDGSPAALSDFAGKGRWVLADFWASWCGPCMNAVGNLRALKDKYPELVLVGINVWEQDAESGPACAKEKGMDWDLIFTSGTGATDAYGIQGIPTLILFAPDGTIAERLLGEQGLEEALETHLAAE